MKHPIPLEALDDRLGFIGTSGSGKTYNAGTAIERVLATRARVVIIDPLGVWWGLRLLADGKTQSRFNVVIFGGKHGDLPLSEHAGALIGETAVSMAESCIIDLSELRGKAAERRFMTAFLDAIYQKANRNPFHLVVDEADLFAPQKPQKGAETLLGHMEDIVRRGRVKGFIPWLISQRPAVINKNVLSQVDGLLAFKLTGTQDRDALDAWIEGQADKARGKEIKDSLATLQIGQGIIWIPGRGILEQASFPQKVTFDSSRTPKRGEKLKSRTLKPLDVSKLKDKLAAFVEQQKASDVPTLKKRIRELEAQLSKKPSQAAVIKDLDAIAAAQNRGYREGFSHASSQASDLFNAMRDNARAAMRGFATTFETNMKAERLVLIVTDKQSGMPQAPAKAATTPRPARPAAPAPRKPSPEASGDGNLTGVQLETLGALAWWKAIGHDQPTKKQLAGMLGIVAGGSTMRSRLAGLSKGELIFYPTGDRVSLTNQGAAIAPEPDMAASLVETIRASLTPTERQTFDAIPEDPAASITREELGVILGGDEPIQPNGSTMRSRLANLSTREIIRYPGSGTVARQDWVIG